MFTVKYKIPIPPSINSMYCNNYGSYGRGRFKSPGYKKWIELATRNLIEQNYCPFPSSKISLQLYITRKRKNSDIDNRIKAVQDLLESLGIVKNDRDIFEVFACWINPKETSYIVLSDQPIKQQLKEK